MNEGLKKTLAAKHFSSPSKLGTRRAHPSIGQTPQSGTGYKYLGKHFTINISRIKLFYTTQKKKIYQNFYYILTIAKVIKDLVFTLKHPKASAELLFFRSPGTILRVIARLRGLPD